MPGGGVYYQGRFHLLIVKINPSEHMVPDRNTGAELVKRAAICKKSGNMDMPRMMPVMKQ